MEEEKEGSPEQEPIVYYLAARFNTREEAAVPYYAVQETIRTKNCDLSAYRFKQQWEDTTNKPWYVVIVGEKPSDDVQERQNTALGQGEMTGLPEEAVDGLLDRRITQCVKGPWVEAHYGEQGIELGAHYTENKFGRKSKGRGHKRRRH
jgi:hypothetical protein